MGGQFETVSGQFITVGGQFVTMGISGWVVSLLLWVSLLWRPHVAVILIDYVPFAHCLLQIDFLQMPVNTLRRYKRHYKLPNRPGLNKSQLADVSFIFS